MPVKQDPILGIYYNWTGAERSTWGPQMDANLLKLAALTQVAVIDRDLATPPATPADGDRYLVAATATGAWAGKEDHLAIWRADLAAWEFYAPGSVIKIVYVEDEAIITTWTGTAWTSGLPTINSLLGLSDTPASYTGQAGKVLAVNATEDAMEFVAGGGGVGISANGVLAPHANLRIGNNSVSPASKADITVDELVLTNSSAEQILLSSVNVTVDITVSGANGLDTGTESADTWYHLWVIHNGTAAAAILSLSPTAPTLPAGYTHKAYVGAVYNDASSDFITLRQWDRFTAITKNQVLSSGAATTYTPVAAFCPLTARSVKCSGFSTDNSTTAKLWIACTADGLAEMETVIYAPGTTATAFQSVFTVLLIEPQTFYYHIDPDDNYSNIWVVGWEY